MKILQYLITFGEEILQQGTAIFSLAASADQVCTDVETGIDDMTNQIYLLTATGDYLDRWAWDLLQMRRKPLESDTSLRSRIQSNLFLANGTRGSIIKVIQLLTGRVPTEVLEPVRDTAYFNAGCYYTSSGFIPNAVAAADGNGPYCARYGSLANAIYIGRVKVQLPGKKVGGAGLDYYSAKEYFNALSWGGDGSSPQRLITIDDLCDALEMVKPTGVQLLLETY